MNEFTARKTVNSEQVFLSWIIMHGIMCDLWKTKSLFPIKAEVVNYVCVSMYYFLLGLYTLYPIPSLKISFFTQFPNLLFILFFLTVLCPI